MTLYNIFRPIVCVSLRENGASIKDILALLSLHKELRVNREYYMKNYCKFKVRYNTFLKNKHLITKLHLIKSIPQEVDFCNLVYTLNAIILISRFKTLNN